MSYAVGSLVRARGREWVVLPDSAEDLLLVRPLGGTEDEVTGICTALEPVGPASFALPDPSQVGDYRSSRLLRDAVRLGFRSSAGPFRSFAQIAVEPRPYQLVPLLMALRLEPVRLLIADDVGIGKTIEAGLVARELMDRGEVRRITVLCPPQLAEQWQAELRSKFHIDAALVLASTATRLERACAVGRSLFDVYPHTVVSTDFIKSDRRREEFLRACPELVIVDEAHSCVDAGVGRGGRHQRFELVKGIARDANRHLILVTATPHSGNEDAFRSLLTLLDASFADLPEDLSGTQNEPQRRRLAAHFVQRQRGDIRAYLDADTPFPTRLEREDAYTLSPEYRKLFDRVLDYARETVRDLEGNRHRQRVRWWSALALLRALGSSPAAAAATLRTRAAVADTQTSEEADELGRRTVLDLEDDDTVEGIDVVPGSDPAEESGDESRTRRRLLDMARQAEALQGTGDKKLVQAGKIVDELLRAGHRPIVFCRFIPTAEYLAAELRKQLPKRVEVIAVTGTLPPAEREARVVALAESPERVLVCTDCLSEGINLQEHFDAVLHYDLSWNPTRHEQRAGRVDRYGQPRPEVRVVTYYGSDNPIDGIVLDVLLRKDKQIRNSLGISVPVPSNTNQVMEAIFEGLVIRERAGNVSRYLPGFEAFFKPQQEALSRDWENIAEREKRSRSLFSQASIRVDEVRRELEQVRAAIGSGVDVARFTNEAIGAVGGTVSQNGAYRFDLREAPRGLRDVLDTDELHARFELPVPEGVAYLSRTHPFVEGLATWVMNTALDPLEGGVARRAGALRTSRVRRRTTLLVVRFRYHLITRTDDREETQLAEDCGLLAFEGPPIAPDWLDQDTAEALLTTTPEANVAPQQAAEFVGRVVANIDRLRPHIEEVARQRGGALLEAHRRVRDAARLRGVQYRVQPNVPPDMLGIYVYLPVV